MSFKFSSVEGNSQKLDGGAMFGNAPRAMWEKWIAPDELGRIPLSCRSFLVEFGNYKILLETGIGAFFEPKLADRFGVQNAEEHMLLKNLKKLGIDPAEITHVILSHLHFDHAGGLLPTYQEIQEGNDQLLFENADYIVGKEAFERALKPHFRDRASFIKGFPEKLKATGRLKIIEELDLNTYLEGRLRFFESNGHTPGQALAILKGEEKDIIFCGDLVPGSHWVHLPITMGYDRFAEKVIEEKEQLYAELDLEKTIFLFTHDHEVEAGVLGKNEKQKYQVLQPYKNIKQMSF